MNFMTFIQKFYSITFYLILLYILLNNINYNSYMNLNNTIEKYIYKIILKYKKQKIHYNDNM